MARVIITNPSAAPHPGNFAEWTQSRIDRTIAVMKVQDEISGLQIKQQNLSMRQLYDAGYVLDTERDVMVKQ